ncbi:MAG: hypothetical protein CM15mV19_1530 [uncultured marine virus]|nr:MAG: hypothetical protein CM15mV19_1530 [uncultured marine virus]
MSKKIWWWYRFNRDLSDNFADGNDNGGEFKLLLLTTIPL